MKRPILALGMAAALALGGFACSDDDDGTGDVDVDVSVPEVSAPDLTNPLDSEVDVDDTGAEITTEGGADTTE